MYRRYCIQFWGTGYDINPIILANIGVDIVDMTDIANIGDIDTENHKPILIPIPKF